MVNQTVLPFKLETTKDLITSHAGLALVGEFAVGFGLRKALDRYLPEPGSGAGYLASEHVFPLVLMLNGGVSGVHADGGSLGGKRSNCWG